MIQDKQRQYQQSSAASARKSNKFSSYNQGTQPKSMEEMQQEAANNKKYARLMNELDQAKAEILALKERQISSNQLHTDIVDPRGQRKDYADIKRDMDDDVKF